MNILVTVNPELDSSLQYFVDAENNFEAAAIALEMFNNEKPKFGLYEIKCGEEIFSIAKTYLLKELVSTDVDLEEVISVCTKLKELRVKEKMKQERKKIIEQINENEMNIFCLKEQLKYLDEKIAE